MSLSLLKQIKQGKGSSVAIEGRYNHLSSDRNGYLDRAREYSRFTLPYVLPDASNLDRGGAANQHGYQGIGAQAVNHLANKLTINMFPTGRSFFNLQFDEVAKANLIGDGYDPTQLSELLVEAENRCTTFQQKVAARVAYTEAFKNLLISGNVCMYLPGDGFLQAIKLDRYVIQRDLSGKMTEIITVQQKAFNTLSEEVQLGLKSIKGTECPKEDDEVKIYTWVYRKDKETFCVIQAVNDVAIKDYQEIAEEDLPWKPLRWNSTYGEDYGRGLCEDHAGDFYVIEFLSEAVAKGMALMADIKYLIKPGSQTDIDEISTAPTGEWVFGSLDDIGVLQLERYADFTPISNVLDQYKRRIGQAFLLNSAVRRDAERVTTVELRIDAQELETSLGGVYSLLAQTMQSPLALLYLKRVGFPLPDGTVLPNIITGLEAFGKIGDLDKIKQYTEMMQLPQMWPAQVQEGTDFLVYSREVAAALSMKMPWTLSEEQLQAKRQAQAEAQQQQQMAEAGINAAPELVKQAGPDILKGGK